MQCLHSRVPYASWRLRVFRHLFIAPCTSHSFSTSTQPILAQQHRPQQHAAEEENGAKDNSKTPSHHEQSNNMNPSSLLPQSPLLTHPVLGLRSPHKKRRPTRSETTSHPDALHLNPWAQALASSVRMCTITLARTPRVFLDEWGFVRRPGSEGLWMMPVGLIKDDLARPGSKKRCEATTSKSSKSASATEEETEPSTAANEEDPEPSSTSTSDADADTTHHHHQQSQPLTPSTPLTIRLISRLPVIRKITKDLSKSTLGKKSAIARILPFRWKYPTGPLTPRDESNLLWGEDIPEFVLGRKRRDVVEKLRKASERYIRDDMRRGVWRGLEGDISGAGDLEEREQRLVSALGELKPIARMECGAVLVMGGWDGPDLVTVPQVGSKVPVFDMRALLSADDIAELRALHPRFSRPALFFRPNDRVTIDALLALWKLKGFMGDGE